MKLVILLMMFACCLIILPARALDWQGMAWEETIYGSWEIDDSGYLVGRATYPYNGKWYAGFRGLFPEGFWQKGSWLSFTYQDPGEVNGQWGPAAGIALIDPQPAFSILKLLYSEYGAQGGEATYYTYSRRWDGTWNYIIEASFGMRQAGSRTLKIVNQPTGFHEYYVDDEILWSSDGYWWAGYQEIWLWAESPFYNGEIAFTDFRLGAVPEPMGLLVLTGGIGLVLRRFLKFRR